MAIDLDFIRHLIRLKLQDGRLPLKSVPSVRGRQGEGEKCDACDAAITKEQLTAEGISLAADGGIPIILHVACFQLWERLALRERRG